MQNHILLPLLLATVLPLGAADISHEFESSYSAATGAQTNLNGRRNGDVSAQNARMQYVLSYAVPERPVLRLGVGYERFDFGLSHPAFIPSTIQAANLVAGVDLQLSDFLIRLETQPGFYGDFREMGARDFNFPVILGVAWIVSKDFQWILGLSYDGNRELPLMGGLGVRWNINDRWLLNIAPPSPRIEYKVNDDVTLFAGARLAYTTYRTNSQFGTSNGDRRFNNAIFQFTEVRAGAGVSWKFGPKGTMDMELGYMAYRDLDFHRLGENYETKSGAFYGQAGIKLNF